MTTRQNTTGESADHGAAAVSRYLDATGVAYDLLEHRATYSAAEDARATGTAPAEEAKVLLVRAANGYRMAVIPASDRLDLHKLRGLLDESGLRLATEQEMAADFPQFEVGAIPPFGALLPALEVLDRKLLECDRIVCAGGDHRHSVKLDPREVVRVADPLVVDVCED